MVRLFIENNELEITNDIQVAITKQFEELNNPTVIINDWSKSVSIPFSQKNNEIFGHIYNPDKVIVDGGSVGVYFNPLKKLDFRLEWNSTVIMVGYAKMNEVKQVNGRGTYELTLFGEIGKVFSEMKKITFDTSTTDTNYLIDGSEYVDEYINKELVYDSWFTEQTTTLLKKKSESGYHVSDILGWAPNNAFSDGFDYQTYQPNAYTSATFKDALGDTFREDTGIEPDTIIPNGMLPREIGEYRSYLQLPFIYWNKLFQIFKEKAEELTGYEVELSKNWFNNSNPYWCNLVYMLKPFDIKKGDTKDNSYQTYGLVDMWRTDLGGYGSQRSFNTNMKTVYYENEPIFVSNNRFNLKENADYTSFKMDYKLTLETSSTKRTTLKSDNALLVNFVFTGENGNTNVRKYLFTDDITRTYAGTDDYQYIQLDVVDSTLVAYINDFHTLKRSELGSYANLSIQYKWYANSYPYSSSVSVSEIHINIENLGINTVIMHNSFHSNGRFILNDLWNKDYNLFDEILKYCKIYRISISIDDLNKKIVFQPYKQYFENYSIIDWTDKIDKSKDFVIKPVTFENKYVLFNYKDSKTKEGETYKEKYGVNYGEYRLVTEYNFNDSTTELFNKVTPSITNTDNVLSWENIWTNHKVIYSFPAEIYVYNKDKDKKQVDIFGAYYFHNGLAEFSTESTLNLRPVRISDDTEFQQANNTYFYTQMGGTMKAVETYPKLDIVCKKYLCIYNVPKQNYTYLNNYSGKQGIYQNIWQKYIDERYSIQNKIITCYVLLSPIDYSNFDWKKLIKVGNQLCIVNKIYDYDVTSNSPVKVDLITVQDVNGYTSNDYNYDYIIASENQLTIPYDYYRKITINASGNWEIHSDDWTDYLTAFPTTGTSGETEVFIGSIDEEGGYTLTFDLLDSAGTNVIASERVECNVGGTSTISVSSWYNEMPLLGSTTVTVTDSSAEGWKLIKSDTSASRVILLPNEGGTGTTTININQAPRGTTGVNDYYLQNGNGDIVSFRVHVVQ